MEPSSPPPRRGRSNVLFAIIAIALLLVGIGAGYVLGRPAPTSMPGAVNNLARPSAIPRVDGWFRNASVSYLDFGPQANVALPILVFFQASSPSSPVAGQLSRRESERDGRRFPGHPRLGLVSGPGRLLRRRGHPVPRGRLGRRGRADLRVLPRRRDAGRRPAERDRRAPRVPRLQRPLARDEGRRRHVLRREQPEGRPLDPRGPRRGPTHDRSDDDLRELSRGELSHETLFRRPCRTAPDRP